MKKVAQVVNISNNMASIKIARATACGDNCASCGNECTTNGHIVKIENKNYSIGELLIIDIEENNVLFYSMIAYGIPLFVMVITAVLSYNYIDFGDKEIVSSIAGLLSLVGSFYLLRIIDTNFFKQGTIIKKIIPFRGE